LPGRDAYLDGLLGLAVEDRHDAVRLEDAVGERGEIVQQCTYSSS
jgi:hypothetical protein